MSWGHLPKDFFDLVKAIGESRSKLEEDRIIINEIAALKTKINEPNVPSKKMKEYLVRALYAEMLGHDASFAYIQAVKLTHEKDLLCKKMGYLLCVLCLHKDHELMLLLINTIQRDLGSANHLEVSAALSCVCRLVNQEMVPAIFPQILKLMNHSNEGVRKKAVMVLHKLYKIQPDVISDAHDAIRRALCDPDPSVMGASLHVIHELAISSPASCKDLVPSLVSILKQITEHRLPRDYDYHRMPAPWLQVKLLSMLATLGQADQKTSEQIYEVLQEVMKRADTGVNVGYAIIYECVKTITLLYPSHTLLELAASSISRFISAENHNLKYVGVTGLASIVQVNPSYATSHQLVVVDCLEDPDESLKRKTLELLYKMTNPRNVNVVVDKLLVHLKESVDMHLRRDLVAKVTELAERYAPSNKWYIDTLGRLFEVGGNLVSEPTAFNLMRIVAEGPTADEKEDEEFRAYAVNSFLTLLDKSQNGADVLFQVSSWVLGEFGRLVSLDGFTVDDTIDLICEIVDQTFEAKSTRGWLLTALAKLISQQGGKASPGVLEVLERYKHSQCTDIQQRCYEILGLMRNPTLMKTVLPYDASCEDIEVDTKLSFLNGFVQKALMNGARAYSKPMKQAAPAELSQESSGPSGLNFKPYEIPTKAMIPPAGMQSGIRNSSICSVSSSNWGDVATSGLSSFSAAKQDGGYSTTTLRVAGPKKWGPQGYNSATASSNTNGKVGGGGAAVMNSNLQKNQLDSTPRPLSTSNHRETPIMNRKQPDSNSEPVELSEREKTAALLFGGFGGASDTSNTSPSTLSPVTVAVAKSSSHGCGVGKSGSASLLPQGDETIDTDLIGSSAAAGKTNNCPPVVDDLLDFSIGETSCVETCHQEQKQHHNPLHDHEEDIANILSLEIPCEEPNTSAPTLLRPLVWNTQQVGVYWDTLKEVLRTPLPHLHLHGSESCESLMRLLGASIGFHTVEIIGQEGIGAAESDNGIVLLHLVYDFNSKQATLCLRGSDKSLLESVATRCAV